MNNTSDMLTQSKMMQAHNKQDFLNAREEELNGILQMNTWKY